MIKIKKNKNKIGLFASLSMMIGAMIGVGIFVKNIGVFKATNNNPYLVITAWVISAIITLLLALSYIEVTTTGNSKFGVSGYCDLTLGKKAGRFLKISQSHFYNGIIGVVLFMYAGELFLSMVDSAGKWGLLTDFNNQSPRSSILMTIGIGFIIFIIFLAINSISLTASKVFQSFSMIIKFLPIIIITIVGIIAGAMQYDQSLFNTSKTVMNSMATKINQVNSFSTILVVLPSILFSFDSFLSFTSIQDKMKNPQKYTKILLSIGVITVSIAYLLITLGMIFLGNGYAVLSINETLLKNVFKWSEQDAQKISLAFKVIFNIFLLVSILGVANAFMVVTISNHQGLIEDDLIFGSKLLKRWYNKKYQNLSEQDKFYGLKSHIPGILSYLFVIVIFGMIIAAISIGLGNDRVADGITNFPTLFFFIIYALIPFSIFIKRIKVSLKNKDKKLTKLEIKEIKELSSVTNPTNEQATRLTELKKKQEAYIELFKLTPEHRISKFFMFIAPVASILVFVIFAYQGIYVYLIDPIRQAINNPEITTSAFGGFIEADTTIGGKGLPIYMLTVIYFGSLFLFFFIPWINGILKKRFPNV
ncbi:amino acid permease [Mycoplasma bradburyae]|uniref:Amino acid permease n=1 Tax=Mycoplasma bradburyae TaxID=2963128 RepID=A0ABT5GBS6_9MOLU|nr:amino acid permease [Mycoplasma bradburyae]MDC4181966.1 amino acid permease [Mycoplasma bradburyae]UTS70391.1 amino acid permease [Mycoplasma bradburyae]